MGHQELDAIACESQTPIVAFKVATVVQGLGIMLSRQLLPSGDVEALNKQRTYCPSITYQYAEEFYAPGKYVDMLVKAGTLEWSAT